MPWLRRVIDQQEAGKMFRKESNTVSMGWNKDERQRHEYERCLKVARGTGDVSIHW